MQKRIQILQAKLVDKKWDGREYKTWECECVLHGFDENQNPTIEVGALNFPEAFGEVSTGDFIATFDIVVNRKDRKLVPKITALRPFESRNFPPVPHRLSVVLVKTRKNHNPHSRNGKGPIRQDQPLFAAFP